MKPFHIAIAVILTVLIHTDAGSAADWPMWRFDSGRTASSPEDIPDNINLLWVRQYSPREPVWDDPLNQDIMPYDRIFEPVVMGNSMFIGFSDSDKLVSLDTGTGRERWTFYTEGPVRLPPAAWDGKVYFTSDDGYLYCVRADNGSLVWKLRGGPSDRKVLGNKRLISMWPARGGPVVHDGVVYFAASIWPFMGTFIRAVDAETGETLWLNDGNGSEFMLQPHNAPSFAGVAPQGSFVISGDKLLIPGGRSVPAVFDRNTGKYLYYNLASSGKTGGSFVCAKGDVFFNHYREKETTMYHLQYGNILVPRIGKYPVLADDTWYFSGDSITAYRSGWVADSLAVWTAGEGIKSDDLIRLTASRTRETKLWDLNIDASGDMIMAGNTLYAAGKGVITAITVDSGRVATTAPDSAASDGAGYSIAWVKRVEGDVERLVAADNKLFAVTLDGRIMAFGRGKSDPQLRLDRPLAAEYPIEETATAQSLLDAAGVREGYALMYGVGDGNLLTALLNNSDLHIAAVDPDEKKVSKMKERFDKNGLYGDRVAVHHGDPFTFSAPQYFASLTIIGDAGLIRNRFDVESISHIFSSMRPYGGATWFPLDRSEGVRLKELVDGMNLHGASVETGTGYVMLRREGALPGAGLWTHSYGDIANTAKSDDDRVKLPLGLLWFGGNSNTDVLPRHGHGPTEQVIGGRLFIEGMDCLSARDVYTGRVIWKTMLHDLGTYGVYFDESYKETPTDTRYNQEHLPGANIRGTNFIATLDRVYVLQGQECVVLDSSTGARVDSFRLPPINPSAERKEYPEWGYIGVNGDYLIGGTGFVAFSDLVGKRKDEFSIWEDFDTAASRGLVVMNRYTGKVVWKIDANHGFLHNGIAVGNGKLFCLDKLPPHMEQQLSRRGKTPPGSYRLLAFDIDTGEIVWAEHNLVFGSFVNYSEEHDILLQSTRPSRDMVSGEKGERIVSFRGADGSVIWDKPLEYATFPIIHGEKIITEGRLFSLLTGDRLTRSDPLTGNEVTWTWKRNYGCNYPIASEHLLTFRSGAAGFFDLEGLGGTGNFGGFKSGCSINLVAADGVLNAPDYTRTCNCAYQNQTSLALVYMPDEDIEVWTFDTVEWDGSPVERVGINFGAPGNHMDDNDTLWLDFPSVGGESPDLPVETVPVDPGWYRFHSSRIKGGEDKWVTASGAIGLTGTNITLSKEASNARPYTVRLHFAEPEETSPGERVFDVIIQNERRLENLDIVREAGVSETTVIKEFKGIIADTSLAVEFIQTAGSSKPPVISGIEILAEK